MPPVKALSKLDDMVWRIGDAMGPRVYAGERDAAGSLVRRLIGDLADDTDVYRPFGTIEAGRDTTYPNMDLLKSSLVPRFDLPPGTEVGWISPYELIGKLVYPEDVRRAAERRTLSSTIQRPFNHTPVPIYVRPQSEIGPGIYGLASSKRDSYTGAVDRVLDIAGLANAAAPEAIPIRTLLHEVRHATQHPDLDQARALRSVSSHRGPGIGGKVLASAARQYLSRPSELLARLAEAGDDFVRKNDRLVENVRDANNVIEMIEAGEAGPTFHPLERQLYVGSYRNNPRARQHINNILMRYFSVPGPVAAGAASQRDEPRRERGE